MGLGTAIVTHLVSFLAGFVLGFVFKSWLVSKAESALSSVEKSLKQ